MTLYLDSADVDEARRARDLGFVRGITTNPRLMARATQPPEDVIRGLCDLGFQPVFYQLVERDRAAMRREAQRFHAIAPGQVELKIPCTLAHLGLLAELSGEITCAATAVYSVAQAYLAAQAGARFVIPYVNRATRLSGDGVGLVARLARMLAQVAPGTEVLAASLKTPAEVEATLLAGAQHVSVAFSVIEAMAQHPASDDAIAEFERAWDGQMVGR